MIRGFEPREEGLGLVSGAPKEPSVDDDRLLIDLHKDAERQGPGGDRESELALRLAGVGDSRRLKIADIGCGTGAATLLLARSLDAQVTAVDLLPEFLEVLEARAEAEGLAGKIKTLCCSMVDLPLEHEAYDLIWSEGAIYNMGFAAGIEAWRRFLKPAGVLVVSEITWLTACRPPEIQDYWQQEYPEIDLASAKLNRLEQHGYSPIGYFTLPKHCWLDHYYRPMENSFPDFLARHGDSPDARAIVAAERREIQLYERYQTHYSYGVYVAKKLTG